MQTYHRKKTFACLDFMVARISEEDVAPGDERKRGNEKLEIKVL